MYSILDIAPLEFATFKLGKEGPAVIACQDAINSHFKIPPLALDGVYGSKSDWAGRELQAACGVVVDGIIGPATQEAFVKAKCKHAELGMTPAGLLAGIGDIESSYQWASVSPLNPDDTQDVGWTQDNIKPAERTVARLLGAFNPDTAAHVLAGETRGFYNAFTGRAGVQRAWELAALAHNWPAAAYALARGDAASLDKPFAFTTAKGYATGLAYCNYYISIATAQVKSWSV